MTILRVIMLILGAVCLAGTAAAKSERCAAMAPQLRASPEIDYGIFDNGVSTGRLSIEIGQSSSCAFSIRLTKAGVAGGGSTGNPVLEFADADGRKVNLGAPWAISPRSLPGLPTASELRLEARLAPGQMLDAGVFELPYELEVLADGESLGTLSFQSTVHVRPQASIRVAGNGSRSFGRSASLNFGKLHEGKERTALLSIRSNAAYAMEIESENAGDLVHALGPSNGRIPYSAWLNGSRLDLAGASLVRARKPDGLRNGDLKRLRIEIGETDGRPAGKYRDLIRVHVLLLE